MEEERGLFSRFLKAMAMEGQTQEINVEVPEGMGPGQCLWPAIFFRAVMRWKKNGGNFSRVFLLWHPSSGKDRGILFFFCTQSRHSWGVMIL